MKWPKPCSEAFRIESDTLLHQSIFTEILQYPKVQCNRNVTFKDKKAFVCKIRLDTPHFFSVLSSSSFHSLLGAIFPSCFLNVFSSSFQLQGKLASTLSPKFVPKIRGSDLASIWKYPMQWLVLGEHLKILLLKRSILEEF